MTSGYIRTEHEIEKTVSDMGYILLKEYIPHKKERRIVIQDKSDYKYDINFRDLIRSHIPNFVDKGNPYTLENIVLWLSINRPEFKLSKDNEYISSRQKLNIYII